MKISTSLEFMVLLYLLASSHKIDANLKFIFENLNVELISFNFVIAPKLIG